MKIQKFQIIIMKQPTARARVPVPKRQVTGVPIHPLQPDTQEVVRVGDGRGSGVRKRENREVIGRRTGTPESWIFKAVSEKVSKQGMPVRCRILSHMIYL